MSIWITASFKISKHLSISDSTRDPFQLQMFAENHTTITSLTISHYHNVRGRASSAILLRIVLAAALFPNLNNLEIRIGGSYSAENDKVEISSNYLSPFLNDLRSSTLSRITFGDECILDKEGFHLLTTLLSLKHLYLFSRTIQAAMISTLDMMRKRFKSWPCNCASKKSIQHACIHPHPSHMKTINNHRHYILDEREGKSRLEVPSLTSRVGSSIENK